MRRRVVVTGLGVISPCGLDLHSTWTNVVNGKSGTGPITLFDTSCYPCRVGAEVKGFDPAAYDCHRFMGKLNRGGQMGLAAAIMAYEDAGLASASIDRTRLGVSIGHSGSRPRIPELEAAYKTLVESDFTRYPEWNPVTVLQLNYHTPTAAIAGVFKAKGPNSAISTACTSGAQAIGIGMRMIRHNDCDVVIAGGFDSMLTELDLLGFCLIGAVTRNNQEPDRASRPFDRKRDGFVLGEGAAVLILEEREHALRRGARIYAELAGYGTSMNAYRMTDSPPDGRGPDLSMAAALRDAGVAPEQVGYINAHGTSTYDGDLSETEAIKRVFGETAYRIPVSSTKSTTGHLISGAGAIEVVFCIQAIRERTLPPTAHLETPDPRCDLDYIPNVARHADVDVALSNSFGFGGSNATIVVTRSPE